MAEIAARCGRPAKAEYDSRWPMDNFFRLSARDLERLLRPGEGGYDRARTVSWRSNLGGLSLDDVLAGAPVEPTPGLDRTTYGPMAMKSENR
jgi:hypothetical protein